MSKGLQVLVFSFSVILLCLGGYIFFANPTVEELSDERTSQRVKKSNLASRSEEHLDVGSSKEGKERGGRRRRVGELNDEVESENDDPMAAEVILTPERKAYFALIKQRSDAMRELKVKSKGDPIEYKRLVQQWGQDNRDLAIQIEDLKRALQKQELSYRRSLENTIDIEEP